MNHFSWNAGNAPEASPSGTFCCAGSFPIINWGKKVAGTLKASQKSLNPDQKLRREDGTFPIRFDLSRTGLIGHSWRGI